MLTLRKEKFRPRLGAQNVQASARRPGQIILLVNACRLTRLNEPATRSAAFLL